MMEDEFIYDNLNDKMRELQVQCPSKIPSKRRHQITKSVDIKYQNYQG
jgi:hypothetical protein